MPGIDIGPFSIKFYGLIIMAGAVAAALLAEREAKRRGENSDLVWDMMPWLLIGGIIGARLWHVFTPTPSQGITASYYLTNPIEALKIWKGGLGIPGAVIGGAAALWIYARIKKINMLAWMDMIAPGLILAQAVGRWGNFVNQELYGMPTDLPWKIFIDEAHRLPHYRDVAYYHPLFLYESLWNLAGMFFLLWLTRRFADRLKPGDVFLAYLVIYPVGRFALEFLRLDSALVGGININQTIMGVIAVLAAAALVLRKRGPAKNTPQVLSEESHEAGENGL